MPRKQEKHVHKFKRVRFKTGNAFYFCALPDCTFKLNIVLALGKRTICWRCGEDFIMTEYSLRLAKPHCDKCHRPKINGNDEYHGEEANAEIKQLQEMSLAERLQLTLKNRSVGAVEEDI